MAKVTKILETTLTAGATSAIFNDADIPNSLIRVFSTNSNIYPQSVSLSGTTLTVTYEAQDASMDVAIELTKQGLDIIDNLTSSDDAAALSAKQGKALKDAIDALPTPPEDISDLSDVLITDIEDGQVLAWDDVEQKFVNVNQSSGSGGFFIDFSNEIANGTLYSGVETTYIATQDCYVIADMACAANNTIYIRINSSAVCSAYIPAQVPVFSLTSGVYVKAGQTITMLSSYTGGDGTYRVYGLQ